MSVLAGAPESDRSYSNSPEMASTPLPTRGGTRSDASSPEPPGHPGNPDILRELLERKRSLLMLSLQAESQVIIRDHKIHAFTVIPSS